MRGVPSWGEGGEGGEDEKKKKRRVRGRETRATGGERIRTEEEWQTCMAASVLQFQKQRKSDMIRS